VGDQGASHGSNISAPCSGLVSQFVPL
jgi:hypothetical protein